MKHVTQMHVSHVHIETLVGPLGTLGINKQTYIKRVFGSDKWDVDF